MNHHAWMDSAACLGLDPDEWFPERHQNEHDGVEAMRVCVTLCKVRDQCLEYALAEGLEEGIYGGMRPEQRKAMKNQRKRERRKHTMASRLRRIA
jgi:WhiB family redox-sensing transcriptional regulator